MNAAAGKGVGGFAAIARVVGSVVPSAESAQRNPTSRDQVGADR